MHAINHQNDLWERVTIMTHSKRENHCTHVHRHFKRMASKTKQICAFIHLKQGVAKNYSLLVSPVNNVHTFPNKLTVS